MHRDEIEAALSKALSHLEDSMKALSTNNDEKAVSDALWSASSETEYAVFLLSLTQGNKAENVSWKHSSSSKQSTEFKPMLASARELLKTAKEKVESGRLEKGYEEAWTARNMLLKATDSLEKKRKEAKK